MSKWDSRLKAGAMLVLIGCLSCPMVAASEPLTDTSIQSQDDKTLLLFPLLKAAEVKANQPGADIVFLDLPDFTLGKSPSIVLEPHPKVRFVRFSQISSNPDIVRAAIVFKQAGTFVPRITRDHLILEMLPASPRFAAKGSRSLAMQAGAFQENSSNRGEAGRMAVGVAMKSPIPRAGGNLLDQKVSLHFEQEDLSAILRALAMKFNLRITADSGVKGRFSIDAQDVPLREVLKNLLLQKDFQYTLRGNDLTVISLNCDSGRVARELLFRDLSLKDALQTLSKMLNVNLIIHESVKDKQVNFYVESLNLDELLDLLISTSGLVKKPYNENTFIIMDKNEGKKYGNKTYRTFKLVNAEPAEVLSMISGSKALADKIDLANYTANKRINAISAYDTPENLELVAKIISENDEKLKQAVIELKLLEINRNGLKQLGISLDQYGIRTADITRLPTSYTIGAALDFLEKENKAKVLASPKIRAVHGKKASINIGEVIPVPYFTYEVGSGSFSPGVTQKNYRDVLVGISLDVMPEISRDNEISLQLNTSVNSVLDINQDGQIHKSERKTNTYVRVKDGETVVLGGLINQKESTNKQMPSFLSKVPLLKGLFSNTKFDSQDSEMIMLVTPHLVNLDSYNTPDVAKPGIIVQKYDTFGMTN